jgi:hypothetical protein
MKSIRNARIQPSLSPSWGAVIQTMEGDIGCVALIVSVGCMVLVVWCGLILNIDCVTHIGCLVVVGAKRQDHPI